MRNCTNKHRKLGHIRRANLYMDKTLHGPFWVLWSVGIMLFMIKFTYIFPQYFTDIPDHSMTTLTK